MKVFLYHIVTLIFLTSSFAGWSDLRINEFLAINDSVISDEYGEYDDWIELYNSGADLLNIRNLYITDDIQNPYKWQLTGFDVNMPSHSYFIIWCDGEIMQGVNHATFSLSGEKETIAIYTSDGVLIDSISFSKSRADVSKGRYPDGSNIWGYFDEPTPGLPNTTKFYAGYTQSPVFSFTGGFYNNSFFLNISPDHSDDSVYFTVTIHDPDTLSDLFSGPINIAQTTIVRAVSKRVNFLPSEIVSNIYIMNKNYSLPVLVTITDSSNLYGATGIYSHPWNEGREWERFAQHQYFINSQLKFSLNSGLRIQGGNSVGMAKKSFRHFYDSRYGDEILNYPLFKNNSITSFKEIVLRSGYDDDITTSDGTLLRDPLSAEFWKKTGGLSSASDWSVLYLNTAYWGIYNVKESIDEDFIHDHIGTYNFDLIRYTKEGAELKFGDTVDWKQMEDFFETYDFSNDQAYYEASKIIDMNDFLNLLAFIHCSQFRSWTWGAFAFKKKEPGARWKWTIWDTDRAFTDLNWNGFTDYQNTTSYLWANFMPKNLMQNKIFKEKLINRTADFLNSCFLPETAIADLDSLRDIIIDEIPNEKNRWNPSSDWEVNVESIRNFLKNRPRVVRTQILNYFSISDTCKVNLNIEGKGEIQINSIRINKFPWNGIYFKSIPVEVVAIPQPGYKFQKWKYIIGTNVAKTIDLISDTTLTAIFIEDSLVTDTGQVVINEIMYNQGGNDYSDDWIELYNPMNTIDLSDWVLKDNNDLNSFIFPKESFIYSNEYIVIAGDINSFSSQHENIKNVIGSFGLGSTGFGLSGSGDMVRLYNKYGYLVDNVIFDDQYPWPSAADGFGPSLQLFNTGLDNSLPVNWTASYEIFYTPGRENLALTSLRDYFSGSDNMLSFSVYPNPVNEHSAIEINLKKESDITIQVLDIFGKVVFTRNNIKLLEGQNTIPLNVSDFEIEKLKGIYILKINDGQSIKIIKFIIN